MSSFERIPDLSGLRAEKSGYDTRYQIDTEHPLYKDPLVDLREPEFGFEDASSYYSQPNRMTGEPLPGIPNAPLVRLDVARRLAVADTLLHTNSDVREALGAPARLKIDDALRPWEVQRFARDVAWPQVIRKAMPDISKADLEVELNKKVAEPGPKDKQKPTPHVTGAAVDAKLINLATSQPFDRGYYGDAKATADPDYYETHAGSEEIVMSRRVLFWAMKEAGLVVNPNEIWHHGKGDPLSEFVSGSGHPYYGIPELPDWYQSPAGRGGLNLAAVIGPVQQSLALFAVAVHITGQTSLLDLCHVSPHSFPSLDLTGIFDG